MNTHDHEEHDRPMNTTIESEAFTSPEALGSFIDARWDVTPEVRDRLAAQLGDVTVHEVILRLVYQLTDDQDRSDAPGGKWGGAWIEIGQHGQRHRQLVEVDTADRPTAESVFGACPECGELTAIRNIGRCHWGTCDTHRTRWPIGSNLFDAWRNETEAEQRHAYEVEPGWGHFTNHDTADKVVA